MASSWWALALAVAVFGCSDSPQQVSAPDVSRFRGVVLLCLDTLRADHLGAYGYPRETSPAIDALAAESVVFERAIAQAASTLPSHRALFQSRHVSQETGEAPVLAEVLREHGFRTAAFTGGGYVAATFGFDRGFERYEEDEQGLGAALPRLEAWLEEIGDAPFFIFLHTYEVHLPYDPPAPFDSMFGSEYSGRVEGSETRSLLRRHKGLDGAAEDPPEPLAPADVERIVALYDGGIRYVDGWVGELMERLGRLGLSDETLVVLFSDHGEEFGDHGSWLHSTTVYEEVVRVPLIWHEPGATPGRVETQVRLADVSPTLLDVFGIPIPESFRGRSLLPLIAGAEEPHRPAMSHARRAKSFTQWPWKLIVDGSRIRLFDLGSDPGERLDLSAREPGRTDEMAASMVGFAESGEGTGTSATGGEAIDPELSERLRSLGYLE
ncbi:MAG: sulfatase [Myxococcota bacterium]|nr:sulfatase [Myxococcota bacterium]